MSIDIPAMQYKLKQQREAEAIAVERNKNIEALSKTHSTSFEIMGVIIHLSQVDGGRSIGDIVQHPSVEDLKSIYTLACQSSAAVATCYLLDGVPFYRFIAGYAFVNPTNGS